MGETSPNSTVTTPSGAVFLSYASQDAEAAKRICDALRAAGVEVWFDQSELRGGEVWDQTIRKQIKACTLFIPVISRHTHERREGYFRLEWKLAVDRSNLISATHPFLIPVVIDDTRQDDEEVPEKIREVHWTRLLADETPSAFVERVRCLLSGNAPASSARVRSPAVAISNAASASRALTRRRKGVVYGAFAAALLALGYFGFERLLGSGPAAHAATSIAVLPLTNESGDPDQRYFSDGLSENLITALSQIPGLKVIARNSSFQFRDTKDDIRTVGTRLGVVRLLEGSVQRAGETVRIRAELINAVDGSTIWSERYDRDYRDLFRLQDDITSEVIRALKVKLRPGESLAAQSDRPVSGNLDAYSFWLQGNFYSGRDTEVDLRHAIDLFRKATQLDPSYAVAWSSLSVASTGLAAEFLGGAAARQAYAEGRNATDKALTLAPDSARAHAARGLLLLRADLDWRGAGPEFNRASQLTPNDAEIKFWLGLQLATVGQPGRAVELTREALATDPLRAYWFDWLAHYQIGLNRTDEAWAAVRTAIELQPNAPRSGATRVVIAILRGDAQAALRFARQVPPGAWQDVALALARQVGTDRMAADAALKTLIDRDSEVSTYQIAQVYALRHEADNAFAWLDRAWSNRDVGVGFLLYDPFFEHYREDRRFAEYCRKVGLPTPAQVNDQT
jgi:TolB-like protein/Tfp pilus assembly protein PilF